MMPRPNLTFLIALYLLPVMGQNKILRTDHHVTRSLSTPSRGQTTKIYVREVKQQVAANTATANKVVLFVHGAGTPGEVAFDVPYKDYSWMEYLAKAGFDVFAMDMTGYGRSTRPASMDNPCNLTPQQQAAFIPKLIPKPCDALDPHPLSTIASDWNDIGAVVDHLLALRHVTQVSLIGWSLGGPRAGGYASQNMQKVDRMVLLSPAYGRKTPMDPPAQRQLGAVMNTQSNAEFMANWTSQIGCPDQMDAAVAKVVWNEMLASDPVGSKWGSGIRRAPQVTTWGWNLAAATSLKIPVLLVAPAHDKQVVPEGVRRLYEDLGSSQKVLVDLACTSHNALWEKNHTLLFQASLDWLTKGSVNGLQTGEVKLGY